MEISVLNGIVSAFDICGEAAEIKPFGCGHINRTYYIRTGCGNEYILQGINTGVFKNPGGLMKNIISVTSHIRKKLLSEGKDAERGTLTVVYTKDGRSCYVSDSGCFRVYKYIPGTVTYQTADCPEVFGKLGECFGNFQNQLSDFDASGLAVSIPDFHNTVKRYEAFEDAVKQDISGRASGVTYEINFVRERKNYAGVLVGMLERGELPLRVTHNDTKMNNVLFDKETNRPICVVDLDTVMPGLAHYDFGDAVRFGACTAAEDEKDLSKVSFDLSLFEAFSAGFLCACGGKLTENEIKYLPFSAILLTYECGMRFLADYINGDVYFKTYHPDHNLDRCRTQLKLVSDMESKLPQMTSIIAKLTK